MSTRFIEARSRPNSLFRLGEYVAAHGIEGDGDYVAGRALLLRSSPAIGGEPIRRPEETALDAALRVAGVLDGGVFPIQGPPGTGKSYTGARMICRLVQQGKKVGITANSHKVIRHLIDKVLEAAEETGVELQCIQKPKEMEPDQDRLVFAKDNADVFAALGTGECQVAGATSFLWSRADAHGVLDVLVVDEAAQMSLANVVAVAQSARTVILLGDPQQLDQPTQGTHPDGVGRLVARARPRRRTIPSRRTAACSLSRHGACTLISAPSIRSCSTTASSCRARDASARPSDQAVPSVASACATCPCLTPATRVPPSKRRMPSRRLVNSIMAGGTSWTDRCGVEEPLTLDDILIITPYNAQVFEIQQRLPGARVGTVDKFQGQEAPIAIYSMATSSHADAPRGMEFLYSSNRFNVAISRAQCMAILVASPEIFEAECKTPRQMQLANAFCRYLELATTLEL